MDVNDIARLACLELPAKEAEELQDQMVKMISFVNKLQQVEINEDNSTKTGMVLVDDLIVQQGEIAQHILNQRNVTAFYLPQVVDKKENK